MRFGVYQFGSLSVDGVTYHTDIVIDQGEVRKRHKRASAEQRELYGHTPLSAREEIPWNCRELVIGTGAMGQMPVLDDVIEEARRRKVKLVIQRTPDAIRTLKANPPETNAILHMTC